MREKLIIIYERDFAYCLAGQLYDQAPGRKPRKAETIMNKALIGFHSHINKATIWGDTYTVSIPEKETYEFCESLLKAIPEFCELTLTQIEVDNGVTLEDAESKYSFTTIYDEKNENSWKSDFIDLDAFIRNFHMRLMDKTTVDSNDCFLCKYQPDDSESTLEPGDCNKCKECTINPNFKNNYTPRRYPKGNYTTVCNYDCYLSKYICCCECKDKDTCTHKCDSTYDTCNNHLTFTEEELKYYKEFEKSL